MTKIKQIVPISIFLAAFVYNFLFGNRYIGLISEGYVYYGALKILNGSILYRDYFAPYTPGLFYLTALFFKIFGPSIAVGRFITYFAAAATAVVVFYLARRIMSARFAVLASVLYTVWAAFSIPFLDVTVLDLLRTPMVHRHMSVTYFSASLALASLLFIFRYLETRDLKWLCMSGVFVGVTMMFKQNTGIFALAAFSLFFLLEIRDRDTLKEGLKKVSMLTAATLAVALPVVVYFYFAASPHFKGDLFDYIIKYPSHGIISPPSLFPLGTLFTDQFPMRVFFYGSIFLFLLIFAYSLYSFRKGGESPETPYLLLISMFGGFMILHVYPTFNYVRFSPALAPFFILLCYTVEKIARKIILHSIGSADSSGILSKLGISSIIGTVARVGGVFLVTVPIYLLAGNAVPITIENYQKMADQNRPDYLAMEENAVPDVLAYLAENTTPDEKILALPADTLIYFLANRDGPSRVPQVIARVDTLEHQEAVINDIEREQIRVIVYSYHRVLGYDILERFPEYASVLYNHIIDNYHIERQISKDTVIFVRDGGNDLWKHIREGSGTAGAITTTGLLEDGSVRTYLLLQPDNSGKSRWSFSAAVPDEDSITLRLTYGFPACSEGANSTRFSAFIDGEEIFAANKVYTGSMGEVNYSLEEYGRKRVDISFSADSQGESACAGTAWIPRIVRE